MTKDSYGYPTKIPTKITDLYGGDSIPTIEDIPTSDDIVEEIEKYLDVDLATEGQVLTMAADGIVEWDDVASGGGINYSTEEQDTGVKWTDGKNIYCKTLNVTHTSGQAVTYLSLGSGNKLVRFEGYHYTGGTGVADRKFASIGYVSSTQYSAIEVNGYNECFIDFGEGTNSYKSNSWHTVITLYYTKG